MIRSTLLLTTLLFSIITFTASQAQPPDSLLIGTISGGSVILHYSEADLECALETVVGSGSDISTVSVEPFGSSWALMGSGLIGSNGLAVAFRLTQHGQQLFLRVAAQWDKCEGINCSSCRLLMDGEGFSYCDCTKKVTPSGYCNHSTGSGGAPSLLIGAILSCTS